MIIFKAKVYFMLNVISYLSTLNLNTIHFLVTNITMLYDEINYIILILFYMMHDVRLSGSEKWHNFNLLNGPVKNFSYNF